MRPLQEKDKEIAGFIRLPGTTSTSESYRVALKFAMPTNKSHSPDICNMSSVLFVICLHNYQMSYNGFRMNSALYSAFPFEREILLMEGIAMTVLAVEEIKIDISKINGIGNGQLDNK